MEPLFTMQTAYTFEEYKKFNQKLLLGRMIVLYISMSLMLVAITLMAVLATRNLSYILFLPLWLILLFILRPVVQNSALKKAYYSNKILQKSGLYTFSFFNDHFESKTARSFSSVEYCYILRILESKTNFYIMIAVNQAYIINKSNCSPELIEFIKSLKPKKESN